VAESGANDKIFRNFFLNFNFKIRKRKNFISPFMMGVRSIENNKLIMER